MGKYLIVNADDFGASSGVNRGILEAHVNGIVTSTSAMVTGQAIAEAVALSKEHPHLGIGLHWDVWGEDEREFDLGNLQAVRDEFGRQLEAFDRLFGRLPTHIDSHRHAHFEKKVRPLFEELVQPLHIPLRGDGQVKFVGGFYGQWEWKVTNLEYISVPFLQGMLRAEVAEGWTEFSCHPGYRSPDYSAVYLVERETEVQTLIDPGIRQTMQDFDIHLKSYADFPQQSG